jgi:uroporphyrinogen decarboxylase
MAPRDLITDTIARKQKSKCAFWIGHPADESKTMYYNILDIKEPELTELEKRNRAALTWKSGQSDELEVELNLRTNSEMIWISPETDMSAWKHPEGKPMWDFLVKERESLGSAGIFAECEDIAEVEAFPWPNPDYLDLSGPLSKAKYAWEKGLAVFGGMWCPFFHVVGDFFGMENYFIKMYTNPDVVHAVTNHIVDFYIETNNRFFDLAKEYYTAGFIGNDFGTQLDMFISPECFDTFILPYIKRLLEPARKAGLHQAFHCCGSVDKIIPKLIDCGVEILHPLQAKAKGMEAAGLEKRFGKDLIFLGGVDTQELLPFKTAAEVREEVLRLRDIFGDHFIVSPSHEALLPNVPFENVLAMSKAAKE